MNYYLYALPIFIVLLVVFMQNKKRLRLLIIRHKMKKRKIIMTSLIERFIGKDVFISLASGTNADGVLKSIDGGWLELENDKGEIQAVNCEYISKIKEYPKNSKGKRKVVFE